MKPCEFRVLDENNITNGCENPPKTSAKNGDNDNAPCQLRATSIPSQRTSDDSSSILTSEHQNLALLAPEHVGFGTVTEFIDGGTTSKIVENKTCQAAAGLASNLYHHNLKLFSLLPSDPPPFPPPLQANAVPTDPVLSMLAERASKDSVLKGLMGIVANGKATKEESKTFQQHIDEVTELLKARGAIETRQSAPTMSNVPPLPPSARVSPSVMTSRPLNKDYGESSKSSNPNLAHAKSPEELPTATEAALFHCTEEGCPKSYKCRYDLEQHEREHSEIQKWHCQFPDCKHYRNRCFWTQESLTRHLEMVHRVLD